MSGFMEVEGTDASMIYMRCECGHVIKKRHDSFLPGAHVIVCLACNEASSEVEMLSGETRMVTAASHRDPSG